MLRRLVLGLLYAFAGFGLLGGCLFLYFMVRLFQNTSPEYMTWLFGFVS